MSDPVPSDRKALAMALLLIEAGYKVFPCRPHHKAPATANGLHDATTDEDQVRAWFDNDRGLNLAVPCGFHPLAQVNLFAIDVDPKHGGDVTWAALTARHGVPLAPRHGTPSGGFHLFFDAPAALRSSRGRIGEGVDHRGEGGYVVVPPSVLVDEAGEIIRYRTSEATALVRNRPPALPLWVMELLIPVASPNGDLEGSLARHPSLGGLDDFRLQWDWVAELVADGWEVAGRRGAEVYMTRPGKDTREGHSAIVHLDSRHLVVFSTNAPAELLRPTRPNQVNRDGSISHSPWDYYVAVRHGGDLAAANAAQWGTGGGRQTGPSADDTPALNLPGDFWTRRPVLTHIRDAAWSAKCSPDALLIHALARTATFVHPCFKLPGVEQGLIGKQQTLDFLGCVVAETSGGKTMAAGVGELLIPPPEPPGDGSEPLIDFEQKVGSGEGIAEFFLVPEMKKDDDGKDKPTGRRIVGKQALFMSVDEGTGFTSQAGRKGTTIVATLASAWSGESLGQLNANETTRRLVQGGRVRICAVINMQDSNGYKLYAEELESVGFTGRLLFASAHDPAAPTVGPLWPGRLTWPVKGGTSGFNQYFTYAPAIVDEIVATRHDVLTKAIEIDRRQSQYLLLRCKVACLLAAWDGRLNVTDDDWSLATEIVTMSATVLAHLDAVRSRQIEVTAVTSAAFKLDVSAKAQSMHVRHLRAKWRGRILERLAKGPQPFKVLKSIVDADRRGDLRDELDAMVEEGYLVLEERRYRLSG